MRAPALLSLMVLAFAARESTAQDRPTSALFPLQHTVAEPSFGQRPELYGAVLGLAGLVVHLATPPERASRLSAGFSLVAGLAGAATGVVVAARSDSRAAGYLIAGIGVLSMFGGSSALQVVRSRTVTVAPLIGLGANAPVGLSVSLRF